MLLLSTDSGKASAEDEGMIVNRNRVKLRTVSEETIFSF